MPYRERTRQWWLAVANYECQYEFYTDSKGFVTCRAKAQHVHHIYGERDLLEKGEDPEHSIALPLCTAHHVRNTGEDLGEYDASFHPDMGRAYIDYKEWKRQQQHMMSMGKRRTIDYSTSPFADAGRDHAESIRNGERYINGDERTDEYYAQKMMALAVLYLAQHPSKEKPNTKPHPLYDSSKKKHWWNRD